MILKNFNALGITVFIVLIALSWVHGNYTGRQAIKNAYTKKALALQIKLDVLKQKSIKEIEAKTKLLIKQETIANDKIAKLIVKNKKLRDWWKTNVPGDAVNFAFGVP